MPESHAKTQRQCEASLWDKGFKIFLSDPFDKPPSVGPSTSSGGTSGHGFDKLRRRLRASFASLRELYLCNISLTITDSNSNGQN